MQKENKRLSYILIFIMLFFSCIEAKAETPIDNSKLRPEIISSEFLENEARQKALLGDFEAALRLQQKAITQIDRNTVEDIKILQLYEDLAKYAEKTRNWQVYYRALNEELACLKKMHDSDTIEFVSIELAGMEYQMQRYDSAIKYLQQAIESTRLRQGDAPKLALPYLLLGMCYYKSNDFKKALESFDNVKKVTRGYGRNADDAFAAIYKGLVAESQNNKVDAKQSYEKALNHMSPIEIIPNTYTLIQKSTLQELTKSKIKTIEIPTTRTRLTPPSPNKHQCQSKIQAVKIPTTKDKRK